MSKLAHSNQKTMDEIEAKAELGIDMDASEAAMPTLSKEQVERVKKLYSMMPGAKMPYRGDYWRFCETIVLMMDEAAGRAVGALCMTHNLV